MRPLLIVGVLLIILGAYIISYDYIPPRKERHSIDIGPLHFGEVVTEEKGSSPAPLIIGIVAIGAGLYLIFRRNRSL